MRLSKIWLVGALVGVVAVPGVAAGDTTNPAGGRPPIREAYVSMPGAPAAGPADAQRVHVLEVGPARARQVLVLEPGQFGAANDFRALSEELAARLPDTQVWAVDRREQNLADLSGFTSKDPDRAARYYLGGKYRGQTAETAPYVGQWGLGVELADLRRVVQAARAGGRRRVILGGHSWGASTALAYAAWDFGGRAGYRDISGLVLIDGGVHDAFAGEGNVYRLTPDEAADRLRQITAGQVFDPAVTMGRTETLPILQQLAGQYAKAAPGAPSTLAAQLPPALRPPTTPMTNLGLLDWLFVTHPLVPDLSVNPAYTRLPALADGLAGPVPAAFEWYWPERLTVDLEATDAFARTPTADLLGLRLWHTKEINVPLYSFASGLTHGTANTAAHWVMANSRIPSATYAEDDAMTHIDALWAAPGKSTVLNTLAPFLAHLDRR